MATSAVSTDTMSAPARLNEEANSLGQVSGGVAADTSAEDNCWRPLFVDDIPANLHCTKCSNLLRRPYQSGCGDRFCGPCLSSVFSSSEQPSCPSDGFPLLKEEVFRDVFAEREVMALKVRCPSQQFSVHKCSWSGELRLFEAHRAECIFLPKPCCNGCGQLIPLDETEDHTRSECPARTVSCQHCELNVPLNEMDAHLRVCANLDIPCPNDCSASIQRCLLAGHFQVCPKQVVKCYYQQVGCEFEGARQDLPAHHEACMAYHLQISMQEVHSSRTLINDLTQQHSSLTSRFTALEEDFICLKEMLSNNAQPAYQFKSSPRHQLCSPSQAERHPEKSNGDHHDSLATRCAKPEPDCTNKLRKEVESLRDLVRCQEQQISSIDHVIGLHDAQLSEVLVRQGLLDVRTTNGVLIWRVLNFTQHQREAAVGKTTSLFSPPFHTSPAGYKLCARLYPNGDGVGRGTHLSLFIVLMKGDFDALLPWPFHQRVALSMLDQNLVNQRNVVETFRPEPSSSSFQRPEHDMNIASGCPLFFPLRALMHSSYLQDDTIFFKITVHTQGLHAPD